MERPTAYDPPRTDGEQFTNVSAEDALVLERLDFLIAENRRAEIAAERSDPYTNEFESDAMRHPVTTEKALSYFGLAVGSIVPAAFLSWVIMNIGVGDLPILIPLSVFAVVGTALTGFGTGKWVGRIVRQIEDINVFAMFGLSVLTGMVWGMVSGALGGLFLFGVGSVFGASLGGIVGATALPIFTLLHRALKRGDVIEFSRLLPIIFGIVFTISAVFLGRTVTLT